MGDIPLPIQSYRSETASTSRLVNVFAEALPKGAKGPNVLRRSPGIASFCPCGTGIGRGLHVMDDQLYAVTGPQLYRVASTASTTLLGAVPGSKPVFMIDNGTQLAISSDEKLYVFDGAVTLVSDPDVISPLGAIDFIDSYLVGIKEGTGEFACSALEDFTDFDALDFATAEGAPDNLLSLIVDHRSIFLMGVDTCELWDNEPQGAGFPFARIPNGFLEIGGIGKYGLTKQDNSVFWVANDRTMRRLTGGTPQRVSQNGVESAWQKYAVVDDVQCHPYTLNGHLCVVSNFVTQGASWVYDCTTQEWHERESYSGLAWDICAVARCYDQVFVQRASTGEIGVLDPSVYDEWGGRIRTEWTYQPLYNQSNRSTVHRLEMGIETGAGRVTGQGSDPRLHLELSRKGGREGTFKPLPSRSLGKQGEFKKRVHWDGLGSSPDTVFRASFSDPNPLTLWSTVVQGEGLTA